jgi:YfiH family protein
VLALGLRPRRSGKTTFALDVGAHVFAMKTPFPLLQSSMLMRAGFSHAFFTREGGVSDYPFGPLNFAARVGDDPEAVAENLRRAAAAIGVDAKRLYFLSQVHGVAYRVLEGTEDRDEVVKSIGDITLSRARGVACGVRSADCVPVLVADRERGAVAAIHSGWRGTALRVAEAGVRALVDLGSGSGDLIAAIGPHIERCCFEVGEDVAAELAACSPFGGRAVVANEDAKPRVDLRAILRAQLEHAGIAPDRIEDVPGCTACDEKRFHSYRRDGSRSGRLLSVIVARGAPA